MPLNRNTRLLEEVLQAGPEKVGDGFHQKSLQQKESGGVSLEIGVSLAVSSASDGDWKTDQRSLGQLVRLANYLDELNQSDIYTLT